MRTPEGAATFGFMPLDDFPYQERAVRLIRSMLETGTFAGTFLVHGPGGVGERELVQAIAKGLFCRQKEADFCDACRDCQRVEHGTFPDLQWLEPLKADYTIDQIRQLQQRAAQKPYEADTQMFVLQKAERMNPTSANALLKLLEEPNPSTVIVLITDSIHALLPTILSRCRKIRLSPLAPETIASRLQIDGLAEDKANEVAAVCGGKLEGIDQLLEGEFFEKRLAWLERIARLRRGTDSDSLALSSELASWKREGAIEFVAWLAGLVRDAIWCRGSGGTAGVIHAYAADRIEELFEDLSERDLIALFEAAVEVRRRLRGNANIELTVETLFLRLLPRQSIQQD